jgi:hypothetical protein
MIMWVSNHDHRAPGRGVITADALHTQRDHAEFLVTKKNAHYILVVKKNQPGLHAQVKNLPWRTSRPAPARRIRPLSGGKKWRTLTFYAITSLTAA